MSINSLSVDIKPFYIKSIIPTSHGKNIPRNFFQTYKTSFLDLKHSQQIKNLINNNPTFNFYFYDDHDMDQFMHHFWKSHPIFEVYKGAVFGASKADIWRYCVLYILGGIYLDIDSNILFDLESINKDWNELISFERNMIGNHNWQLESSDKKFFKNHKFFEPLLARPKNTVLQWLLIFRPGHPILMRTINLIAENAIHYKNIEFDSVMDAVMAFSGPIIYSQAVWEYVQNGNSLQQADYDFNNMATFKSIPDLSESVYFNDKEYYARKRNKIIYK